MTVFYKSQRVADLLKVSLLEVRDLSDAGKLTTKLEDGEMLVAADSLVDLADDNAFSLLKDRFPAFAKSRGLGTGSLFPIGAVANLLGVDSTSILDMVNVGALGAAVSDDEQMVSGESLRNLIIGDQYKYGSLIPSLGHFALTQTGLDKVSGFGIPSVEEHLGVPSLRPLIDGGAIGTILDEGNEYVEAESLNQYVQGEPAYADSKYKLGDFIFSQLGFNIASDSDFPTYETTIAADLPNVPHAPDVDGGGIGLREGAIGAGIAGVVGATAAGISGKLPDVDLPSIDVPDVNLPQVDFPDVDLPSIDVPDVNLPDVPDVSVPNVDLPDMPDVSVPNANLPNVPDVNLPDVPDVAIPDVNVPDVDLPDIPDVGVRNVDLPNADLPDVGVPDVDLPAMDVGGVRPPSIGRPDLTPAMGLPKWLSPALLIALAAFMLLFGLNKCNNDESAGTTSSATPVVANEIGGEGSEVAVEKNESGLVPTVARPATNTPRPDAINTPRPLSPFMGAIGGNDTFSALAGALSATGLDSALEDGGPYTLFAPVNNAFNDAPSISDNDLSEVLTYHVIDGQLMAEDVAGLDTVTTLQGEELTITVEDGTVFVDGARVIGADAEMENGVMHVIDTVLVPASVRPLTTFMGNIGENNTFSTLAGALSATGLDSALEEGGPYTLFAPVNSAFSDAPSINEDDLSELLTHHVIEGQLMAEDVVGLDSVTTLQGDELAITVEDGTVFVNGARVIGTDAEMENGVMHIIDNVLVPASLITPEPTEASADATPEPTEPPVVDPELDSIASIVGDTDGLSTLAGALSATGLFSTLDGDGPFTVFAPLNAAFTQLPEGTLESLSEEQLSDVLLYHVVDGKVMAADVVELDSATTLLGEDVTITVEDGTVFVNDAQVIATDIEAENGVIHLLYGVLIPEAPASTPEPTVDPAPDPENDDTVMALIRQFNSLSTLTGALDATKLSSSLEGDGPFTILAPVNSAFANLPEGTLDALTEDQLLDVLLYHVVAGNFTSDMVAGLSSATTLQGEDIEITVDDGNVLINGAGIVVADLQKENGVVHVIDTILLPPSLTDGVEATPDDPPAPDPDPAPDTSGGAAANVHIIMDASWSMTLPPDTNDESQRLDVDDPDNRISLAREALVNLVTNDIPEGTPIGLRAFGNLEGNYSCRTDLMAAPGELNNDALAGLITGITPQFNANTPLADSIAAIPSDIAELEGRTVVILITDGAETCFGEPGVAAVSIGAPRNDISLNVIGLSIDDDRTRANLERIAEIGEGSYYDVTDIDQFSDALKATLE